LGISTHIDFNILASEIRKFLITRIPLVDVATVVSITHLPAAWAKKDLVIL
jgi:hypothetical protein